MKSRWLIIISLLVVLTLPVSSLAHVPITAESGETLETAIEVNNPTKSWVIYSELHEAEEPNYFKFEMEAGSRIRVMMSVPIPAGEKGFIPKIALMGPGVAESDILPEFVDSPENVGVLFLEEDIKREYEGFTPTAFYSIADLDMTAPESGTYYLVVYDEFEGGKYSIAIGYQETFTLEEWIMVPFNVIDIHLWSGQSLVMILLPYVLIPLLGLAFLLVRSPELRTAQVAPTAIGLFGGLLFLASGGATIYQMIVALSLSEMSAQIIVTILFALMPIALGSLVLREVISSNSLKVRPLILAIYGVLGLFTWAGFIIASLLILTHSALVRTGTICNVPIEFCISSPLTSN